MKAWVKDNTPDAFQIDDVILSAISLVDVEAMLRDGMTDEEIASYTEGQYAGAQ